MGLQAYEYLFPTNSALAAGLSVRDTTASIRPVHPEPAKPEAPNTPQDADSYSMRAR